MANLLIGRHLSVSSPDYLLGAVREMISLGFNCLMIYTSSPRKFSTPSLTSFKIVEFKNELISNQVPIDNVVVHASYLINLANYSDSTKLSFSKKLLREQLVAMKKVGLHKLVIHPGSALSNDRQLSLQTISDSLNEVLTDVGYYGLQIIIETMSGKGTELGITFQEIRRIIDRVTEKEKIFVCWDTCHMYSAGYQIRERLEDVIKEFDDLIGLDKLSVIHLNDSLHEFNSRKDRHLNIGKGTIGLNSLKAIANHSRLQHVIKIMETPTTDHYYKKERGLLTEQ